MATQLFGCYRASEANDPETFITAAAALLARYPEEVARKVCDPSRGLPSTNKFLPAISELRDACEREMVWHDAVVKRERQREHTREVLGGHKAPLGSPEHRRVLKSFKDLAAMWPEAKAQAVAASGGAYGKSAPVSTPAMASYLDRMRSQEGSVAGDGGEL
jgi:hypothetical protein